MAQFALDLDGINSLFNGHLEMFDEVAPKMLEAAAPLVEEAVIARAPKATGKLKGSIKLLKPKKTKNGGWISNVTIKGTRKIGDNKYRNMEIAAWNEYGTKFRPAKPFLRPAIAAVNNAAVEKMTEVFNEELKRRES